MAPSIYLRLSLSVFSLLILDACAYQPIPAGKPLAPAPTHLGDVWRLGPLATPNPTPTKAKRDFAKRSNVFVSVYFTANAATLNTTAKQRLDQLLKQVISPGGRSVPSLMVTGFTEGQAQPAHNQALALKRARAVRDYLINEGIKAARIQTQGHDDCCYAIDPTTPSLRRHANASDRRVDIRLASPRLTTVAHFKADRTRTTHLRLARYSIINIGAVPKKMQPLAAVIKAQFSCQARTVGDAIQAVLSDSGYRLARPAAAAPAAATLLTLPLPRSQRTLGPLTLQAALATLAGSAYRLVLDPVHRLVSLALADAYQNTLPNGCAVATSSPSRSRPLPPCRSVRGATACPPSGHAVLIRNLTVAYAKRVYRLPNGRYCKPKQTHSSQQPQASS